MIMKLGNITIEEDCLVIKEVGLYDMNRKFLRNAKMTPALVEEIRKRLLVGRDGLIRFGSTFYDADRVGQIDYFNEGGEYKPVER